MTNCCLFRQLAHTHIHTYIHTYIYTYIPYLGSYAGMHCGHANEAQKKNGDVLTHGCGKTANDASTIALSKWCIERKWSPKEENFLERWCSDAWLWKDCDGCKHDSVIKVMCRAQMRPTRRVFPESRCSDAWLWQDCGWCKHDSVINVMQAW